MVEYIVSDERVKKYRKTYLDESIFIYGIKYILMKLFFTYGKKYIAYKIYVKISHNLFLKIDLGPFLASWAYIETDVG